MNPDQSKARAASSRGICMIFAQWRARRASRALIEQILGEIVAAARRPALYQALAAPDRVADAIAQDLVNCVFTHFDDTLREMGLSDIAVAKRLKAMGSAFYGRNAAYAAALDDGSPADLARALARNVYGAAGGEAEPKAEALARYVASLDAALAAIPLEAFATGRFRFPPGSIAAGDRHD